MLANWLYFAVAVLILPPLAVGGGMAAVYLWVKWNRPNLLARIFPDRPGMD